MMNNLYLVVCLSFLVTVSCKTDSNTFDTDKLKGKYKVDLMPTFDEIAKEDEIEGFWGKMAVGLTKLATASGADIEMTFYDNNKGLLKFDGFLINLLNATSDKSNNKITEFSYKVEQDSILYMKKQGEPDYKKWAIIHTYSEHYDYLKFIVVGESKKDTFYFDLAKVDAGQ